MKNTIQLKSCNSWEIARICHCRMTCPRVACGKSSGGGGGGVGGEMEEEGYIPGVRCAHI